MDRIIGLRDLSFHISVYEIRSLKFDNRCFLYLLEDIKNLKRHLIIN